MTTFPEHDEASVEQLVQEITRAMRNGGTVRLGMPRSQFWALILAIGGFILTFGAGVWLQLDRVLIEQRRQSAVLEDIASSTRRNADKIGALEKWQAYEAGQRGTSFPAGEKTP